jgi:metal-sulfur cluster biosynthetic enzyme
MARSTSSAVKAISPAHACVIDVSHSRRRTRQFFIAEKRVLYETSVSAEQVDMREIQRQVSKIVDPEIGMPIVEMNLIDKLDVKEGNVDVEYHATTQFCPPVFALKISQDLKDGIASVKGVKSVRVMVTGHYFSDAINRQVNKTPGAESTQPAQQQSEQSQQS